MKTGIEILADMTKRDLERLATSPQKKKVSVYPSNQRADHNKAEPSLFPPLAWKSYLPRTILS
jgi:hypothetical protein